MLDPNAVPSKGMLAGSPRNRRSAAGSAKGGNRSNSHKQLKQSATVNVPSSIKISGLDDGLQESGVLQQQEDSADQAATGKQRRPVSS